MDVVVGTKKEAGAVFRRAADRLSITEWADLVDQNARIKAVVVDISTWV